MTKVIGIALAGLAVVGLAGAAHAGSYDYAYKSQRKIVGEAPLKDCTKFNGRYGYYGNPYCTPAEQARWDRWEARNLTR